MRSYKFLGVIFGLVGLVMLFVPAGFVQAIMVSLGVAAFANGIYTLLKTRHLMNTLAFSNVMTVRGILSMAVGVVAVTLPLILAGTIWMVVAWLFAGYLLLASGLQIWGILKLREAGIPATFFSYEVAVSIIIAVILIIIPGSAGLLLVRICGGLVLLGGLGTFGWSMGFFDRFRKDA